MIFLKKTTHSALRKNLTGLLLFNLYFFIKKKRDNRLVVLDSPFHYKLVKHVLKIERFEIVVTHNHWLKKSELHRVIKIFDVFDININKITFKEQKNYSIYKLKQS